MTDTRDGDHRPIHWHEDAPSDDLTSKPFADEAGASPQSRHSGGHALMMLACCIPMVFVVVALVATGVVGAGAIAYALLCVAMMAAMMLFMPGHRH
ncbi:hypothetical protein [Knoellia aerolata]|jgi:hypothetical protein|nr:hypothetical protein [Knoellia aerolata]